MATPSKLHAVIISSPGMGHIIPVLELAKHLVTHHRFTATAIIVSTNTSAAESLTIRPYADLHLFDIVDLQAPDITPLVGPNAAAVTRCAVMVRESLPAIRSAVAAMDPRPDVLIADLFGTETLKFGDEFGIPKYIFVPTTAYFLAITSYLQVLDKEVVGEYVDQKDPFIIPGCKPLRPEDVIEPMVDRSNQQYWEYVKMGIGFAWADGILLNTWEDLESQSLKALRENESLQKVLGVPVYPIGPLMRKGGSGRTKNVVTDWLDNQPNDSVIYVSFGSGGTMSSRQITELAWGLELSQQRFVWVVRAPNEKDSAGSFFTAGSDGANNEFLPDGFLTRTRDRGLVVPQWVSQYEVLSHPSVGGFMTHCGWNSILESLINGVPMIAWPLYAEQRINATRLAEELGVAVRPKVLPTKKVVGMEEIEIMVRRVMADEEGMGMRVRVKDLISVGEKALRKDGTSYKAMSEFISDCETKLGSRNYSV